jgi:hypothetical protein
MSSNNKWVKKPEKIPTLIYLEPETREMLRTLALHLYNLEKGSISKVVEEAVELYYKTIFNTENHNVKPRSLKAKEAFRRVLECIKTARKYSSIYEIAQITQKELEVCISQTLGSSRPTIRHYIELFVKHGYIKKTSPIGYEINA